MENKVRVVADELGNPIVQTSNPEIGYVKLEQNVKTFENGWLRNQKRTALIFGKIEDLKSFNFKQNQELDGKIVINESFTPFNASNAERELKIAGKTGIHCHVDGQPIYRISRYTTNLEEQDVFIQHNNTEEIREALQNLKESESVMATLG